MHVFSSNVLSFLEASANSNIAYSGVGLNVQTNELILDGVADSYATLVSQVAYFEKQKAVKSVTLGQNSFNKTVKFNIKVILVPGFLTINSKSS